MHRKTILHIEVTSSDFEIQYNGAIAEMPTSKEDLKHDERLMRMLASNRQAFDFFYRIVEPARRFYKREEQKKRNAKKNAKQNK
jgi:hypothetical protein